MDEQMFNDGDLRLALEAQTQKIVAAVDAESEEVLKQADLDEWAAALAHHFAVACPELATDAVWMEPPTDVGVDVSRDWSRAIIDPYSDAVRNYPGYRVVVHVPFGGDREVFKLTPSTYTVNHPRCRIARDELLLTIDYPHDSPADIDAIVNGFTGSVNRWLGYARVDIDAFNRNLEQQARQAIEHRRRRLAQRDAHLAGSAIPVRRPAESETKTYIPDVLVRRPAPSLPDTRSDRQPPGSSPPSRIASSSTSSR